MSHPLDPALRGLPHPFSVWSHKYRRLPALAHRVGDLGWPLSREVMAHGYPARNDGLRMRLGLTGIVKFCDAWLRDLGVEDPAQAMRDEYDRARTLHPGMTLEAEAPTDDQRFAALLEEQGEVARACTYDAHTDRGHAGELTTELVQLGMLAAAWAIRYMPGHGGEAAS